jgi:UDP-GlcNAc:undecaprenyl-phosphate GlcNAc-1-phosphate transferase
MLIGIIVGLAFTTGRASYWHFLFPAAILVAVGLIDDRRSIGVSARLAVQILAALAMMLGGGLYLQDIGDPFGTGILGLGILAIPISVVITLTVINAFNFVDGIDGLAASMALIALVAGALASGLTGSPAVIAVITCGAILGFLPFNFPGNPNSRFRAFMGDAGSTLLGFIVVWFTIAISQGDARSLSPVAALWFALMPLSDFFSCVARRVARRKLPLQPGREHFHYMLMRAGLSGRQVLAVLVGFGVFYAAVGLIGASAKLPDWALFAPWITLLGMQYFIIKRLALLIRYRRWKGAAGVVLVPELTPEPHFDEPRREAA